MSIKFKVCRPLNKHVVGASKTLQISEKLEKRQIKLLESNPEHNSLKLKKCKPKDLGIWQFYISTKYRAWFIVVDIKDNTHYVDITYCGNPHN